MQRCLKQFAWAGALAMTAALPGIASPMGSLAPHDAPANGHRDQPWVADPSTNCRVAYPDFTSGDSISWQGKCSNGMAFGPGTLTFFNSGHSLVTITGTFTDGLLRPGHVTATWPDGATYDGDQLGGLFNGPGKFVSVKGETFAGEWKLGALNGNATVHWANGDTYQGSLKNGTPDGSGVEVWANGDRYEGEWRDGQPVARETAATANMPPASSVDGVKTGAESAVLTSTNRVSSPEQPTQTAAKPTSFVASAPTGTVSAIIPQTTTQAAGEANKSPNSFLPLRSHLGMQLTAVDGAILELALTKGGFDRTLVLPNGTSQHSEFTFANGPVGTISDGNRAVGVFRAGANQLDIDYADGANETIAQSPDGGLVDRAHMADGRVLCTAWYPQGHGFSEEEKKAAVQEYANRLGIAANAQSSKRRDRTASETCGGAFVLGASGQKTDAVDAGDSAAAKNDSAAPRSLDQRVDSGTSVHATSAPAVSVAMPAVHVVDAAGALPTRIEPASFTPAPTLEPTKNAGTAAKPGASDCLSVASDGEYWGFQNRCTKAVQFAYCEMGETNPLTSCKHSSVSGSVAANGFSALVSDRSLGEKSVNHEFRWMACNGGAGEVVAHLDKVDPPSGRCERAISPAD